MLWHSWKVAKDSEILSSYTHGRDVYLGKHPKKVAAKRWTWKIKIQDTNELIPATKIELNKNGNLSANLLTKLSQIKPITVLRRF